MSGGAPWSVKGIDPKAREAAKELARRSGMTLGEWLNHIILDDDIPEEVTAEAELSARPRFGARQAPPVDSSRLAQALERLTDRIESSETRTGLAINGVEHSVRLALARIETAERQNSLADARLEAALAEQARQAERLKRLEAEPAGPRALETLKALEARVARGEADRPADTMLADLGERLAAAEQRTGAALEGLKAAMADMDRRLASTESGGAAEARFEAMARGLSARVDAVRAEVAQRLQSAGSGDVESRLARMDETVRAAERRSTQAVEQMGRQVLAMAEAVSRKLTQVDERSAEAIDQVGTEVARIASAVELRLARTEHAQTGAFERLGEELNQITARLGGAPAAQTPPPAEVLAFEPPAEAPAPPAFLAPHPEEAEPEAPPTIEAFEDGGLPPPPEPLPEAELEPLTGRRSTEEDEAATVETLAVSAPVEPERFEATESEAEAEPQQTQEDLAGALEIPRFTGAAEVDEDIFEAEARELPPGAPPPLSTREVIEQARASARAKAESEGKPMRRRNPPNRLFPGLGARRSRPQSTLQTALMVAGGAAFLTVGAAGLSLMGRREAAVETAQLGAAPRAGVALGPVGMAPPGTAKTPVDAVGDFPMIQADIEAGRVAAVDRLKALAAAGYPPAELYLAQLLEAGGGGLVQNLAEARRLTALAAEAGEPRAMHNLAVYFFRGDGGPQDLASAAQWFRKAADAGVVESQFNLGLLYQSGSGVTKDLAQARQWFEKAAEAGDQEAREAALALGPKGAANASKPLTPAEAQRILARLGYYEGAADGRVTPAYRTALSTYQRQHGRQPTGALDPATASALAVYRR